MKIDFVKSDRQLIVSAADVAETALVNAGTAIRKVGHQSAGIETDQGHLKRFVARYEGKKSDNGEGFEGTMDVPEPECVVMRIGILLLLERHQRTDSKLQEELALVDKDLGVKLGELRRLGMRFGGQADLFDTAAAKEKQAMGAEMGLSGAALGAAPSGRKRSAPANGAAKEAKGKGSRKPGRGKKN